MGLFRRNNGKKDTATVQPVEAEQPSMSADELERMVYATYEEKLDLAKKLDDAKARIDSLTGELRETKTQLRAAEEFARQSQKERRAAEAKIAPLEQSQTKLNAKYQKAQAHSTALEIKVDELTAANQGRMDAYRRTLIEEIKQAASDATGGWSKARVLDFLDDFYFEGEA